jgi:stage II sporulation protein D
MKQLLIFTMLFIVIPFFIVIFFVKEEKEIEYIPDDNNIVVRVKKESDGTIINVPLEEYVMGVVAGEMPINFNIEALKAQAVAARSYVMKRIEYNKNLDYDVVDTVMNQVYLDDEYLRKRWGNEYTKINL